MNKNTIKKFAMEARLELISRVSQKAEQYGITAERIEDRNTESVNGTLLSSDEKSQRRALIAKIKKEGYEEVMEEVAYTWFNRFIALRFMEVNGYLPTGVRVFTDEENNFKPQILNEAITLDLKDLNMDKVYTLKEANQTEELYKYLLITQCNALSDILPGMFQQISDYTELLFPDNLLREGSVIQQMIELIPEEDWRDAVQIMGWMYQYYISEKKDDVFAALKKNVKITKENIPAATQIFTPDWIVRYMVENSLGRLWVEGHPNDDLKGNWRYYLEEAEQEPEVQVQLADIRKGYADMEPQDIKVIDPCCGSGHILVYMFDVLMQIYEKYGYAKREAVSSIIRNNLYGLDIDDRAAQLAYFAVMMKARQYDRRFFSHTEQPHVHAICESNHLDSSAVDYFCNGDAKLTKAIATIREELYDAKEYGSILTISQQNWSTLYNRFAEIFDDISMFRDLALEQLLPLVQVAEALAQKYDAVVTNPPYMGSKGMNTKLSEFVKKNYPDSKADLFAVFIEKWNNMVKKNGINSMVTTESWMFLSSFENMRIKILQTKTIVNLLHMGSMVMGIGFSTSATLFQNTSCSKYKGTYNYVTIKDIENDSPYEFPVKGNRFAQISTENFSKIPGIPFAYWVSDSFIAVFSHPLKVENIAFPKQGLHTGNNNLYLRFWTEVDVNKIMLDNSDCWKNTYTWAKLNKGGSYRKWFGNREYIINWNCDGAAIKGNGHSVGANNKTFFENMIGFTDLTSYKPSFRFFGKGFVYDVSGSSMFNNEQKIKNTFLLSLLNSKVCEKVMEVLSPTLHMNQTALGRMSIIPNNEMQIDKLAINSVDFSRIDWNSFETSWDFARDPMVKYSSDLWDATGIGATMSHYYHGELPHADSPLEICYLLWKGECEDRFQQLKANEEELNRIFIDIYGLQNELTPEVEDKDVTVYRIFDSKDDIPESMGKSKYALTRQDVVKNFISYAVGCMFGRYSLDAEGLIYAGGEWDASKYRTFPADDDNIIPISDDEYFEDDIVGRLIRFVETVFGKDSLEDNLRFIAAALGGKGHPREVIRNYFLNDFYKDHCKMYQKRPIYWLFDSGKKNGFKALIYMHRYQPDTIARIRTDYVHEQQSRYCTAIEEMERRIASASTSERVRLTKALGKLKDQANELLAYEEKIHHLADQMIPIDLDDGVKHNYEIFKDVLAKIK